MNPESEITGQCLCGAVRFAARPPTLFCSHCHCWMCRQAHGAAFVTWLGVPREQFRLIGGEADLTWFRSSKQGQRGFCAKCGSTLFFESTLCPGEIHLTLANILSDTDRAPDSHVFFDQRVDWFVYADELKRLASDSPRLSRYQQVEV